MKRFSMFIPIIAVALVGCNQKLKVQKVYSVPAVFQEYVDGFEDEAKAVGKPIFVDNISIRFSKPGQLDDNTLGQCTDMNKGEYGTPHIEMNIDDWDDMSLTERKAVLYHELGHCVLWRDHDEGYVTENGEYIVKSIMFPYIQDDGTYLRHWSYYMHELFYGF